MKLFLIAIAGVFIAAPAFADQPNLAELITDTVGYFNVAENVVVLEGDTMGTFICRIDVSDAAFDEYVETGALAENDADYACIPIEELNQ